MIEALLKMPTADVFGFIQGIMGPGETDGENYLYYPGNNMCLVAHVDTLASYKDMQIKRVRNVIWNAAGILGADDRAGVLASIAVWQGLAKQEKFPKGKIPGFLFTNHEETGGRGAKVFLESCNQADIKKYRLFIALDREGCNQFVYYNEIDDEILGYAESFAFVEEFGIWSDIAILSEALRTPSINLSVGYYDQHTSKEMLHLDETALTARRVMAMCKDPIDKKYKIKDAKRVNWENDIPYQSSYYGNWGGKTWPGKGYDSYKKTAIVNAKKGDCCLECGKPWDEYGFCIECGMSRYDEGGISAG